MANQIQTLANQLLSNDAVAEIGKKVGLSSEQTKSILSDVLPDLLQGASSQANSANTKDGFLNALLDHSKDDVSNLTSFFKKADLADGEKIINHLLGKEGTNNVSKKESKKAGISSKEVLAVLSCAAPFLMSLMGKETSKEEKESGGISFSSITNLLKSNDISSLATSLLGGGKTGKKDDGFGLDDVANILGSVLKK